MSRVYLKVANKIVVADMDVVKKLGVAQYIIPKPGVFGQIAGFSGDASSISPNASVFPPPASSASVLEIIKGAKRFVTTTDSLYLTESPIDTMVMHVKGDGKLTIKGRGLSIDLLPDFDLNKYRDTQSTDIEQLQKRIEAYCVCKKRTPPKVYETIQKGQSIWLPPGQTFDYIYSISVKEIGGRQLQYLDLSIVQPSRVFQYEEMGDQFFTVPGPLSLVKYLVHEKNPTLSNENIAMCFAMYNASPMKEHRDTRPTLCIGVKDTVYLLQLDFSENGLDEKGKAKSTTAFCAGYILNTPDGRKAIVNPGTTIIAFNANSSFSATTLKDAQKSSSSAVQNDQRVTLSPGVDSRLNGSINFLSTVLTSITGTTEELLGTDKPTAAVKANHPPASNETTSPLSPPLHYVRTLKAAQVTSKFTILDIAGTAIDDKIIDISNKDGVTQYLKCENETTDKGLLVDTMCAPSALSIGVLPMMQGTPGIVYMDLDEKSMPIGYVSWSERVYNGTIILKQSKKQYDTFHKNIAQLKWARANASIGEDGLLFVRWHDGTFSYLGGGFPEDLAPDLVPNVSPNMAPNSFRKLFQLGDTFTYDSIFRSSIENHKISGGRCMERPNFRLCREAVDLFISETIKLVGINTVNIIPMKEEKVTSNLNISKIEQALCAGFRSVLPKIKYSSCTKVERLILITLIADAINEHVNENIKGTMNSDQFSKQKLVKRDVLKRSNDMINGILRNIGAFQDLISLAKANQRFSENPIALDESVLNLSHLLVMVGKQTTAMTMTVMETILEKIQSDGDSTIELTKPEPVPLLRIQEAIEAEQPFEIEMETTYNEWTDDPRKKLQFPTFRVGESQVMTYNFKELDTPNNNLAHLIKAMCKRVKDVRQECTNEKAQLEYLRQQVLAMIKKWIKLTPIYNESAASFAAKESKSPSSSGSSHADVDRNRANLRWGIVFLNLLGYTKLGGGQPLSCTFMIFNMVDTVPNARDSTSNEDYYFMIPMYDAMIRAGIVDEHMKKFQKKWCLLNMSIIKRSDIVSPYLKIIDAHNKQKKLDMKAEMEDHIERICEWYNSLKKVIRILHKMFKTAAEDGADEASVEKGTEFASGVVLTTLELQTFLDFKEWCSKINNKRCKLGPIFHLQSPFVKDVKDYLTSASSSSSKSIEVHLKNKKAIKGWVLSIQRKYGRRSNNVLLAVVDWYLLIKKRRSLKKSGATADGKEEAKAAQVAADRAIEKITSELLGIEEYIKEEIAQDLETIAMYATFGIVERQIPKKETIIELLNTRKGIIDMKHIQFLFDGIFPFKGDVEDTDLYKVVRWYLHPEWHMAARSKSSMGEATMGGDDDNYEDDSSEFDGYRIVSVSNDLAVGSNSLKPKCIGKLTAISDQLLYQEQALTMLFSSDVVQREKIVDMLPYRKDWIVRQMVQATVPYSFDRDSIDPVVLDTWFWRSLQIQVDALILYEGDVMNAYNSIKADDELSSTKAIEQNCFYLS